jgi:hypothetical protein
MLYSCFGALALAMRILPSAENVHYRVSLARRYVDVGHAAAATRAVCIRTATPLALRALDMVLLVAPALEWSAEIARVLLAELRAVGRMERMQCVQLLLSGLGDVSRAATSPPAYADKDPSTALEVLQKGMSYYYYFPVERGIADMNGSGCLFLVLSDADLCEIPTVQALLQGIVDSHLNYALSLQEGREPVVQEESQDEYGQFDLNWDDP